MIGVCLNRLLLPVLRDFAGRETSKHYTSLKSSNGIDTQVFGPHLTHDGAFKLNYGSINNNWDMHKRKERLYHYKVTTDVDLAKLYLEPHMAKFTGEKNILFPTYRCYHKTSRIFQQQAILYTYEQLCFSDWNKIIKSMFTSDHQPVVLFGFGFLRNIPSCLNMDVLDAAVNQLKIRTVFSDLAIPDLIAMSWSWGASRRPSLWTDWVNPKDSAKLKTILSMCT